MISTATDQPIGEEQREPVQFESQVWNGAVLMALAGIAFVGYGIVFLVLNFGGSGFELGVSTLAGMTSAELDPRVANYISHLHVATATFTITTGIAVAGLSWYGVRQRQTWAWATANVTAVVGLALALPIRWTADALYHD